MLRNILFENIVNSNCRCLPGVRKQVRVSGAHFNAAMSHKLGYHGLPLPGEGKPACVRVTQGVENDFLPCVGYGYAVFFVQSELFDCPFKGLAHGSSLAAVRVRKKIGKGLCQSDICFKFRLKCRGHDLVAALAVFGVSDVNVFAVKIYVADFEFGNFPETQTAVQADERLQINGEAVLFEFVKKSVSFLGRQKTHAAVVHFGQGDFGKRLGAMIKTPVVHFVDNTLYYADNVMNRFRRKPFPGEVCNKAVQKINVNFIDVCMNKRRQIGMKKAYIGFMPLAARQQPFIHIFFKGFLQSKALLRGYAAKFGIMFKPSFGKMLGSNLRGIGLRKALARPADVLADALLGLRVDVINRKTNVGLSVVFPHIAFPYLHAGET